MSVNHGIKKHFGHSHSELYNELEIYNFNALTEANLKFGEEKPQATKSANQLVTFQKSIRILLFCGQCVGLLPVLGIFETQSNRIRFNICSWKSLYSIFIGLFQAVATILSFCMFLRHSINITVLGFVGFYSSCCLTTFIFLAIAKKWPALLKEISTAALNEYCDFRVQFKCNAVTGTLLSLAFFEIFLHLNAKITILLDCFPKKTELFMELSLFMNPWFFELGVSYSLFTAIVLKCINIITAVNLNFSDLFIICICIYLTSILNKINQKVVEAKEKNSPPVIWRSLREDYTTATRLVRSFDDVISSLILASFARNLFFICLYLFSILTNGVKSGRDLNGKPCPNYPSGIFGGYEDSIYIVFSISFILVRFLLVSLIAARVHTASLVPAPALYDVSSADYCDEIQRFIEQVHGNNAAMSGLQFFYITNEMVLSIAGTIITYELVLLQFNGEDIIDES